MWNRRSKSWADKTICAVLLFQRLEHGYLFLLFEFEGFQLSHLEVLLKTLFTEPFSGRHRLSICI